MIKIAFTSIFYPLFMGRYILEAFLRRDDCEVWTAGPYTGRWIPWRGGMHLPASYLLQPDHPLAGGQSNIINYKMVENKCPFEPDLWLEVNSTLLVHNRPEKGIYAVVGTDPHVLNYDPQRAKSDFFFNMQTPYMKEGDIWLPYGYDPVWHAQTEIPAAERKHDATLLGLNYDTRDRLVARLRAPNNIMGRGGEGFDVVYDLGPCYDDAREIYHDSVVGLNYSSLKDTTARVFELMAFGITPVINRVPDLVRMFEDRRDYLGFDTEDEAVSMVHAALNDLDWAQEIGDNARRAVEPHSWDARAEQILKDVGLVTE